MVRDISGKHHGYYEAILQLRNCREEVVNFVKGEIKRERIYTAKVLKVKGGLDFYLADKDFARHLGKKLQENFGGEVKVTASLWGKKEGKEVYRLTILFRGLDFKKGDIVVYEGEEYEIKSIKKDIVLKKMKTGKNVHIKYKEMKKIKMKNGA